MISYQKSLVAIFELFKPRIIPLVLITTFGGMWLTPMPLVPLRVLTILGWVFLLVAGANAINMYLERDLDRLMTRTADRPLPTQRIPSALALWIGLILSIIAVFAMMEWVNPITGLLAAISLLLYTTVYTPLKRKTPLALWIGAVPGAMPAWLGWTALTHRLDLQGLSLFAILYIWQIPHFLAISIFRKEEYFKAGIKVMPLTQGNMATCYQMIPYAFIQIPISLMPAPLGLVGRFYFIAALILGIIFFGYTCLGIKNQGNAVWARRCFFLSIIYLPLLYAALVVDRFLQ
ncbi:MAG: protoheme IX farnesyltransferase [Deltaproteobacteria bacterium]|nr:protoheme IX farnesyltransferase [Deltaproteobacteria bacterium]